MTDAGAGSPPSGGVDYVARWDLDKTYLRTDFDTLRDLVRTAIERPDRKRSVPGAAALLRELGRSGARVHILSGSPRQMRGKLEEKLAIDRVRFDELTLKPNLSNMMRGRLRALRDQLGYKLPDSSFVAQCSIPPGPRDILPRLRHSCRYLPPCNRWGALLTLAAWMLMSILP